MEYQCEAIAMYYFYYLIINVFMLILIGWGYFWGVRNKDIKSKARPAFITGSFVYGLSYRDEATSDIDIVVFTDNKTIEQLEPYMTDDPLLSYPKSKGRIRTGGFDLILISDEKEYDHWKHMTETLKQSVTVLPATKDMVVDSFEEDRKKRNLEPVYYHNYP